MGVAVFSVKQPPLDMKIYHCGLSFIHVETSSLTLWLSTEVIVIGGQMKSTVKVVKFEGQGVKKTQRDTCM